MVKWWLRKYLRTARNCIKIFRAQMFGRYQHSGHDDEGDYHRYEWRGQSIRIPVVSALQTRKAGES